MLPEVLRERRGLTFFPTIGLTRNAATSGRDANSPTKSASSAPSTLGRFRRLLQRGGEQRFGVDARQARLPRSRVEYRFVRGIDICHVRTDPPTRFSSPSPSGRAGGSTDRVRGNQPTN